MTIRYLLEGVTAAGPGPAIKLDVRYLREGGSIPIVLSGVSGDSVELQATIATDAQVREGTAKWSKVVNSSWTADISDGLFTPYTHIRGNVISYNAGNIYLIILV